MADTEIKLMQRDQKKSSRYIVPVLPVKGMVVFPFMVIPLMANEQKQARLIDEALMKGSTVGIFVQSNQDTENPGPEDIRGASRF